MRAFVSSVFAAVCCIFTPRAGAQHLWWDTKKLDEATCLYGEITVLATKPGIYYCGANWHPGEPAGGYCGIQHNTPKERRTIFSIWDTAPKLHPKVTRADPETICNRFGGEGEGAHTHMVWDWEPGDPFQFFLKKEPGSAPDTTDASYYVYDRRAKKWRHSATLRSPNGNKNKASVINIGGGGLASFLEKFTGQDKQAPKLALYRLWLGNNISSMKCLTQAQGDGTWGQLRDTFFLADGDSKVLDKLFDEVQINYGKPVYGKAGKKLPAIADKPVPANVLKELQSLPQARAVQEK